MATMRILLVEGSYIVVDCSKPVSSLEIGDGLKISWADLEKACCAAPTPNIPVDPVPVDPVPEDSEDLPEEPPEEKPSKGKNKKEKDKD